MLCAGSYNQHDKQISPFFHRSDLILPIISRSDWYGLNNAGQTTQFPYLSLGLQSLPSLVGSDLLGGLLLLSPGTLLRHVGQAGLMALRNNKNVPDYSFVFLFPVVFHRWWWLAGTVSPVVSSFFRTTDKKY